jgi:murein DD-endopeptidase MepM/ murein hydrolase activator NlpD
MRRLTLALAILLVVATPAFGDDVTKKHQVDDKISSLQDRLAAQKHHEQSLRNAAADFTSRIRALEGKVGDVSLHLQTIETDLSLHQRRLDALNALFGLQTKRYDFLQAQYATSIATLDRRLVEIYESDPASTLDVFLGARNVQDALDQVQYLNDIGEQDRRIAQEVAAAKAQVKAARATTRGLRTSVEGEAAVISARAAQTRDVRDQLVGAKSDLAANKDQKLTDLSQLTADERAEAGEIDALQAASNAIGDRIRAAQAQHGLNGATSTPSASGLVWPVSGPITSPFGMRWGSLHPGIDIGVPTGTPIKAAAAGKVIYCGWMSGYGNLVMIDHGGGIATLYGHQSRIASSCDEDVAQGQIIGYTGCTGFCTGPHLHFEVRVNGTPVDPLGYLGG